MHEYKYLTYVGVNLAAQFMAIMVPALTHPTFVHFSIQPISRTSPAARSNENGSLGLSCRWKRTCRLCHLESPERADASSKILVIEGGINASDREDIIWVNSTNGQGGDFDWNFQSVPQVNLDNRVIPSNSGKGLGGGTLINGGMLRTTTSKRFRR
jgi:hypothetical protein